MPPAGLPRVQTDSLTCQPGGVRRAEIAAAHPPLGARFTSALNHYQAITAGYSTVRHVGFGRRIRPGAPIGGRSRAMTIHAPCGVRPCRLRLSASLRFGSRLQRKHASHGWMSDLDGVKRTTYRAVAATASSTVQHLASTLRAYWIVGVSTDTVHKYPSGLPALHLSVPAGAVRWIDEEEPYEKSHYGLRRVSTTPARTHIC
jgi:hypothetical protein